MDIKEEKNFWLPPAPPSFGHHPGFLNDFGDRWQKALESSQLSAAEGKQVGLSELYNPLHPEVYVIPRDKHINVVDSFGDSIGFERITFPFSSTDFYVDIDEKGIYNDLCCNAAFHRLGQISQLGYLVPPWPEGWEKNVSIVYTTPQFHHTRWIHSLLVAILADVVMARNGFTISKRAPVILAFGCHDLATPVGGDSVKRVDPVNLDEEANFTWSIRHYGLDRKWKRLGFNVKEAQKVVMNEGVLGKFLDIEDKIAYTALDCRSVGMLRPGKIRDLCVENPLIMDIWQDIRFSEQKDSFIFINPDRLFNFLLLRAYEFQEFLFNPYSRALDLYLKNMVQPLYEKGLITKEDLLTNGDMWLENFLKKDNPELAKCYIEPENLSCRKFNTEGEQKKFAAEMGKRVDHLEHLSGFSSGLDWKVLDFGGTCLREAVSKEKVELLEEVIASTKGYYVYYSV
ncbi:MAG: HD domain-containing protein [Candidatus Paceibacterota bacterium]|jgi:hypothetical protein